MIFYLNNILIFTQTLEDYQKTICKVFKVLARHMLFLYPKKYEFDKQQIKYLGLVISEDQVAMNSIKIARVCDQPTLQSCMDIQVFLEFTNFYYKFICDFSDIACPLFDISSNNTTWAWEPE